MATEKQIEANRLNALKSTGPKTEEGKAKSRRNAVKHGLAGEGVALPEEDRLLYRERLEDWAIDLRPRVGVEQWLVATAALASVRVDRCAEVEFTRLELLRREILGQWEDEQNEELEKLVPQGMDGLTREVVQKIKGLPMGWEWLVVEWRRLRNSFERQGSLDEQQLGGCLAILGLDRTKTQTAGTREEELARANAAAAAGGSQADQARRMLSTLFEEHHERLKSLRLTEWETFIAPRLSEAIQEEAFDASPRAALMRRYETACRNDLKQALSELARIRKGDLQRTQESRPEAKAYIQPAAAKVIVPATTPSASVSGLRNEPISDASRAAAILSEAKPNPSAGGPGRMARRKEAARRARRELEAKMAAAKA